MDKLPPVNLVFCHQVSKQVSPYPCSILDGFFIENNRDNLFYGTLFYEKLLYEKLFYEK